MGGLGKIKAYIRDHLPQRWQVPVKYAYLKARGGLETELALLPQLITAGERAIDIGANYGTYSLTLARLGARIEVFEPNPRIAAVLVAWAQGKRGITVHPLALSDREGSARLHIPCDETGVEHDSSASLLAGLVPGTRAVDIRTARLDSLGLSDIALIKIDVEGHEQAVLDGARATIAASQPALIVEIDQRHIDRPIKGVIEDILALGYRGCFLCEGQLLPIARFDPARHQSPLAFSGANGAPYCNNFIFLPESRVARGAYRQLLGRLAG